MASTPLMADPNRSAAPLAGLATTPYAVPVVAEFDNFYRDEWHTVVGLALALTGDRGATEDLTQEAFASAFRDWDRIGAYDEPDAFVRRVVANRAVSRGRRLARVSRALSRIAGRRRARDRHRDRQDPPGARPGRLALHLDLPSEPLPPYQEPT